MDGGPHEVAEDAEMVVVTEEVDEQLVQLGQQRLVAVRALDGAVDDVHEVEIAARFATMLLREEIVALDNEVPIALPALALVGGRASELHKLCSPSGECQRNDRGSLGRHVRDIGQRAPRARISERR